MQQEHTRPSSVPSGAKPEGETQVPQPWAWVEASIWTERMLAALDNGVTGGKWYSLMDTPKDHQRWPNAFFAAQGLFTLYEAYGRARQSR